MTQAPAFESDSELLRLAQGLRDALGAPAAVAQSHRVIVGFRGKARLYYYPPAEGPRLRTPLVLFPYLGISRPYIFDLRPGESFAEFLSAEGIPFYLVDWGVFGPEDRDLGLDDIVADMIPSLLRQALRHAGAPSATVFGYCMGVPMTAAALAHDPSLPAKNFLAMVGPIDFTKGEFPRITDEDRFDVDAILETFDMMPAEFIRTGFKMLNPLGDIQQAKALLENAANPKWLEGYKAMNRWANEWVPLPKQFFRHWVRHFYQRNELLRGELRILGRRVDLGRIRLPILCVAATKDDIVPAESARALLDAVSSTDTRFLELEGGHISVIAGRRARAQVWPALADWLREHD
ncbi:alpha/beta fold hydrolase [Tepidiforma sp.]|uniref:alpha/beta fold hydrolase n=1 Tax=Tepidiforma sp. TaxID=2682230 RepID=UPI002ADD7AF1|nr:alpha/beta fold hydrolase [Tepidiforma sp.]